MRFLTYLWAHCFIGCLALQWPKFPISGQMIHRRILRSTETVNHGDDIDGDDKALNGANHTVCFDDLGCYDRTIGDSLPASPSFISPWYSFNSADKAQVNVSWDASIEELKVKLAHHFIEEGPLIIVAHGFGESIEEPWMWSLNSALLTAYPGATTMLINWKLGCLKPLYPLAAANTPLTARITYRLVSRLMSVFRNIKAKNIHFIGFSLGGQFAGFFARQFKIDRNEIIGRITSLDGAAPLFENMNILPRRGDALFVEAVHTDAGNNVLKGKFGILQPYGDVDYYPNGGLRQPACSILNLSCSHQRAFIYYIYALSNLKSCQMRGQRCESVRQANEERCDGPSDPAYLAMTDVCKLEKVNGDRIISFKTSGHAPFCISS